ncbi:acetyltransferase [Photobacterium angustum]|uniref:N-acetyltransferase n=1 Tax=Photobacterium angustum TaxID=661 RepID=A0ABX5H6Y3_PHOAN|nr:GNAT family N-acetyltransferase [Photobacterium angustum]KJG39770.1 acetyltransferase [Photobacterium angustum]PSX11365.1 N-acetyltransferase [Photobacterium angustum]
MKIRAVEASGLDSLLRLNHQNEIMHFENSLEAFVEPSSEEKEFLLQAINDQSRLFLVADISGDVVGFITATMTQNTGIPFLVKAPICCVGTIVVDENVRVAGIGTKLMAQCNDWAKYQGAEQIRLEVMAFNKRAQSFYATLGFE